jgi:thymidylate synthase (FAD)
MKLIESSYKIIPQESGVTGLYKQIELAGRLCYKSEDKICEGSAIKMVDNLVKRGHGSPLEHGTVYMTLKWWQIGKKLKYVFNKYSKVKKFKYVTTNYRVLVENNWLKDIVFMCEPTENHEKRVSVKVNCAIAITREFNRHRVKSICESSTRYCNYSLDKFGNELTFVIPDWVKIRMNELSEDDFVDCQDAAVKHWWEFMRYTEHEYLNLIKLGLKPQEARSVLALDTATEVMYTAFVSDWKHFFKLRTAFGAHPDARAIACPLEAEFKLNNYI